MKTTASTLIITATCLLLSTSVYAQQGQDQGERRGGMRQMPSVEERVEELDKAVGLTDAQKKEITTIWTEQMEAMRQRFQESDGQERQPRERPQGTNGGERAAMPGGMRGMRGGMMGNEALEKLLTPEQMTKYQAYQESNMVQRRIDMMDRTLGLTDDQKAKIAGIIAEQNKMMAPSGDGERDARTMQREMRKIQMQTDRAIEDILTEEQVTKYRAMPRPGARRQ